MIMEKEGDSDYGRKGQIEEMERNESYLRWTNDSITDFMIRQVGQRDATTLIDALG